MDKKGLVKDIIIVVLAFVVAGAVYIGYSKGIVNFGSKKESSVPAQQIQDETAGWKTYTNGEYGFEVMYPPDFNIKNSSGNESGTLYSFLYKEIIGNSGDKNTSIVNLYDSESEVKVYLGKVPFQSYSDYVSGIKKLIQGLARANRGSEFTEIELDRNSSIISKAEAERRISGLNKEIDSILLSGGYGFEETSVGGVKIILDKSDSYGVPGSIYNMYVWLNDGNILVFHNDNKGPKDYTKIVDEIYHSFKFIK